MANTNNKVTLPVFITGGCGMVGTHLVDHYHAKGETVLATYYTHPTTRLEESIHKAHYVPCDVRDKATIDNLIDEYRPEIIFHLAAQSYPTVSWEKPVETFDINVNGTIHVMEAIKRIRKTTPSYDPIVLIACSSAEYGSSLLVPENLPANEDVPLLPLHPYGVSKVAQDLLGYQYFMNDGIRSIRVRIFNTTGPRKTNDVVSDFTKRTVLWEKQQIDKITVGNLHTKRAITDVRDLINALLLLSEKGVAGDVYNVCGSNIYEIQDIVKIIEHVIGRSLATETDPQLLRPTDEPIIWGDASKLVATTGWQQTYAPETTIKDMIAYWRTIL